MSEGAPNPIVPSESDPNMQGMQAQPPAEISNDQAVLAAAERIVNGYAGEAAKDAPAGPPLSERSFSGLEGLAAATDSAMQDAEKNVLTDVAQEGAQALEPRMQEIQDSVLAPHRQAADDRDRRQAMQGLGASRIRPSGLLGQSGAVASRLSQYRANQMGSMPKTPEQPNSTATDTPE